MNGNSWRTKDTYMWVVFYIMVFALAVTVVNAATKRVRESGYTAKHSDTTVERPLSARGMAEQSLELSCAPYRFEQASVYATLDVADAIRENTVEIRKLRGELDADRPR